MKSESCYRRECTHVGFVVPHYALNQRVMRTQVLDVRIVCSSLRLEGDRAHPGHRLNGKIMDQRVALRCVPPHKGQQVISHLERAESLLAIVAETGLWEAVLQELVNEDNQLIGDHVLTEGTFPVDLELEQLIMTEQFRALFLKFLPLAAGDLEGDRLALKQFLQLFGSELRAKELAL